jgi:uncharacterized protein YbbC (DUF1343 family)
MKISLIARVIILTLLCTILFPFSIFAQVKIGADLLFEKYFDLIKGKKIGLVTNHTAMLANGKHLADALFDNKEVKLVAFFGPEHGVRGDAIAGENVKDGKDEKTGIPVYSLYGKISKPTKEMLANVDVLLFDIQDVGVRFYTYISTLSLSMEGAAEAGVPFIVLDRPNPITGNSVEGYIRDDSLASFVGLMPTPVSHGMTVGEFATMVNEEGWLKNQIKANLTVIKMEGWHRGMWYDQTGLVWIKPSPNIISVQTAAVYPGTCFFEGTNLSEGRGTEKPFEYIGAPFIDGTKMAADLNTSGLPGVTFRAIEFTPQDIPNVSLNPKHRGVRCGGVFVDVTDRDKFEPVRTGVYLLAAAKAVAGDSLRWRERWINRLSGTPSVREHLEKGVNPQLIVDGWRDDVQKFLNVRKKYLMYE